MRLPYQIPFWKAAPLTRLLVPLIAGIMLQWYLQFTLVFVLVCLASFFIAYCFFYFFPVAGLYQVRNLQGLIFCFFITAVGMLITWQRDSRNQPLWYGNFYNDSAVLVVKINEPLVEKARSFKADGVVLSVVNGKQAQQTTGKILLYFSKDSIPPEVQYGQIILVKKPLQPIKNSGNPGAFNYKRYAAFQQFYHQLFLKPQDWLVTKEQQPNFFYAGLYKTRDYVLNTLKQYIGNNDAELGIAEALLIGFKEDLDKNLVQAYSNTGVVHIIAISGLHLGLIFIVLTWLFNRTPGLKKSRHVKVILLITCLWLFSLLTGGAASVLRSAVMFTVIIIGKYYFKQASVYNSLAASAFILLCYNPYYLWDVGFQLSYFAVAGIVALQKPIYQSVYFKNKMLRKIWEMASITLAAQIAAFPICIYYFHQFPNLFLFTNLLVVPLSTIVLFGEILLVCISAFTPLANILGAVLTWLISLMNRAILFFNGFSFSVVDNIYADIFTTWLLYGLVFSLAAWYLSKNKKFLRVAIFCLAVFSALHVYARIQLTRQKKMVVYNVSKHKAIDFISAEKNVFEGDSILKQEGLLQNFHLKPARVFLQVTKTEPVLPCLKSQGFYRQFYDKRVLVVDSAVAFEPAEKAINVDVLLMSNNPSLKINDLVPAVSPAIIVFDASNSLWKIESWKKECEELHLRCYSVAEQGAFVLDIR